MGIATVRGKTREECAGFLHLAARRLRKRDEPRALRAGRPVSPVIRLCRSSMVRSQFHTRVRRSFVRPRIVAPGVLAEVCMLALRILSHSEERCPVDVLAAVLALAACAGCVKDHVRHLHVGVRRCPRPPCVGQFQTARNAQHIIVRKMQGEKLRRRYTGRTQTAQAQAPGTRALRNRRAFLRTQREICKASEEQWQLVFEQRPDSAPDPTVSRTMPLHLAHRRHGGATCGWIRGPDLACVFFGDLHAHGRSLDGLGLSDHDHFELRQNRFDADVGEVHRLSGDMRPGRGSRRDGSLARSRGLSRAETLPATFNGQLSAGLRPPSPALLTTCFGFC